jgi:hypothetical protein
MTNDESAAAAGLLHVTGYPLIGFRGVADLYM